ncbi:carboxy-S-adenosyl-L-methionine synthase CmoA [Roseiconus nitratireducens]|uniref:Carboxy-S-adenosyl-L-methionine synthase n=1 Tax=Roseiconus nitratireducens TaxID=2605748 RepID=A0A5M6CW28_9BACT|nr:carboxy-S-adenosyl-L-methionine synthase CmoA [Roseiconus nitratireducens]KAA5539283.1 carboxy-S-adenosyl-L-methionine synthase CmoA [Roseiconus nitratireducens]
MSRDQIYALPRDQVGQFQFDEQVARVFPDMIARSVPGYGSILSIIEQLSARFVQPGTQVYDLGCSLGAATLLMQPQIPPDATIHAVDNAPAMIDRLRSRVDQIRQRPTLAKVQVHLADVVDFPMDHASLVVLNFTLQFIASDRRRELLDRICQALIPGGALLLSEKICFDDPHQQQLLSDLHLDFKRACGYSELEIAQKRTSLEKTLIPESLATHTERLQAAGFATVAPWFQCFNFASILAIKGGQGR